MATETHYHDAQGRIECNVHAPRLGSAEYRKGGWKRMNSSHEADACAALLIAREIGLNDHLCESCRRARRRRIARRATAKAAR